MQCLLEIIGTTIAIAKSKGLNIVSPAMGEKNGFIGDKQSPIEIDNL
jgi:hypothetical protein